MVYSLRKKRKRGCLGSLLTWFIIILVLAWGVRFGIKKLFPMPYMDTVLSAAETYDVEPALLYALIKAESNFDVDAESVKDAKGLVQMLDETAAWCAKKSGLPYTDITDPTQSIPLGAFYLGYLLDMYEDNETCAVAAYNAGHGRVDGWLSDLRYSPDGETLSKIPFPETDRYVKKVQLYKKVYEKRLDNQ